MKTKQRNRKKKGWNHSDLQMKGSSDEPSARVAGSVMDAGPSVAKTHKKCSNIIKCVVFKKFLSTKCYCDKTFCFPGTISGILEGRGQIVSRYCWEKIYVALGNEGKKLSIIGHTLGQLQKRADITNPYPPVVAPLLSCRDQASWRTTCMT